MIKLIKKHADLIVNILVLGSFMTSIILWSHRRLEEDMNEFRVEMKVINARLDATNLRIDHTYSLILDMMKEQQTNKSRNDIVSRN